MQPLHTGTQDERYLVDLIGYEYCKNIYLSYAYVPKCIVYGYSTYMQELEGRVLSLLRTWVAGGRDFPVGAGTKPGQFKTKSPL